MIPSPNLDDKNFQEIVDEAIRLIPHYCPEWTNHNPTDPGITLIELFAWMSEMIIYRLNKVPDKTYLTLLDLIGLSLVPPNPAKALLTFFPVEGYEGEAIIKRGTQVSTVRTKNLEPIVFETEKDIVASNMKLVSCFCVKDGLITDNINNTSQNIKGFSLFSGKDEISRYLYISDPLIGHLKDVNALNITFYAANEIKGVEDEIVNYLSWEYWNGKKWTSIEYLRSMPGFKKNDNQIYFTGPINIEENEVENNKGFYLRALLVDIPGMTKCFELIDVTVKLLFHGEGLIPDMCICNTDNMVFYNIDLNKDFKPFVNTPKYNDAFYIASDEVFSKEDSESILSFYLSNLKKDEKSEPNTELILRYEYWNGKNWLELGSTTINGVYQPKGDYNFIDTTNCFTKNGEVRFIRPNDMKKTFINNKEFYWIRVRICAGDFGIGGQFVKDEQGKWGWEFDKTVDSPDLSSIRLKYIAKDYTPDKLISYYDYTYYDYSVKNAANFANNQKGEEVKDFYKIFEIIKEKCPTTYFGFDKKFVPGDNQIFFKLDEVNKTKPSKYINFDNSKLNIKITKAKRSLMLKWEYYDGKDWKTLSINDYTDNFHESGFIEFKCPEDIKIKKEFGSDLYWLRVIFESGSFEIEPKILNIHLNSVYAYNMHTHYNELLGSSNGTPSQEFYLLNTSVLPGMELLVKEIENPPTIERDLIVEEEGPDAIDIRKGVDGKDEIWIRYHQVENFYSSKPYSRHYCIDYINSKIIFGNGSNGIIPSRQKNNLRVNKYKTGGGVVGNVGAGSIITLRESIPYIAKVTNYYSAEGGSDLEDLDNLKERAVHVFKNLNRAVTVEDYEWLARESSSSVGRSKCLSKCGVNGEVILIILPKPDYDDYSLKDKLYPSTELLRRVKEFLDIRKLVGTKLRTEAPSYRNITINIKLVFKKEVAEIQILKDRVENSIYRYLHPIAGGHDGKGWQFGMNLTKNEIFKVVENIEGIYYIEEIEIKDDDANVIVDKLICDEDDLIFINKINISERKYQY